MNPWSALKGLRREIWILCASTLVNRAGTMVLPFLVLYLTRHLGFEAGRASLAFTLYGVGSLVTGPLAGFLCDRFGSLRVMKVSLALSGLVLLPFPLVTNFWAIMGLILTWSIVGEAFRPANLASLSELARPEQRRAAFALNRQALNLGMSIGPAAGGMLAAVSFPALFEVNGTTTLLSSLVLVLFLRGHRASDFNSPHEAQAAPEPEEPTANNRRRLLLFFASFLPAGMVFCQLFSSYPLFLVRNVGLTEFSFGLLLTVNTGLIILLEVPLNTSMARWKHARAMGLGAALLGAGFGATAWATGFWTAAAATVIWTFGEMILLPTSATCLADLAPPGQHGRYMGLYQATFSLAVITGPWLGTHALEGWGSDALWLCCAAVAGLSSVLFFCGDFGQSRMPATS